MFRDIILFASILTIFSITALSCAEIQNDKLRVSFNEKGELTGIYNKISDAEYYHGNGKQILKLMHLQDKATHEVKLRLESIDLSKSNRGESLSMKFSGSGISADVKIDAPNGSAKTSWSLEIRNSGDLRIVEAAFPDLDDIYIGNDKSDDFLVRPNRYGEKIPNPSENLFRNAGETVNGLKYQAWWSNPKLEYGGEAGMFWMDVYDGSGGLYLASEDKQTIGGYLENRENNGIGMALGKYIDCSKDESVTLKYAIGVHTGDWHWAADRYREWAETFMIKAYIPRWVREMPNWYWVSSIWSMGFDKPKMNVNFKFNDINKKMFDSAIGLGGYVVGMAGIEFMGHDYPLWWPDPAMGTEEEARLMNADMNRRGGKAVPYINPIYAWENYPDVPHAEDSQYQERVAKMSEGLKQPDWDYYKNYYAMKYDGGYNFVEMHYHGNFPQMCLASREWQDYVLWWTHKYAVDYGFNGVQWDQLGAYQNQYCVDEKHNHKYSGSATSGTMELCRRIYNDPKYKVGKDFYIWYEGASDIYHQYMQNCHSGFDSWMAWGFPEMIQYTFPHNFYGGEYFDDPTASGPALIRNKRSIEYSILGRYKLGTGQNSIHGYKVSKLAPMVNALKGLYWYTDFKDDLGCIAPEGIQVKVLEIDPEACPYITQSGYIIPYMDIRKNKKRFTVSLNGSIYDLSGIVKAYWYPAFLQGERKDIAFRYSDDGNISADIPSDGGMNAFTMDQSYCETDDTISNVGMIVLLKEDVSPISVIFPMKAKRGETYAIRTVRKEILGDKATVSASFGSDGRYEGINMIPFTDGMTSAAVKNGVECVEIKGDDSPYMYLDIDNKDFIGKDAYVEVKVRYLDEGKDTFRLQYNSTDMYSMPNRFSEYSADYKSSSIQYKQNSGIWKTATFILPDAYFAGKMNADCDIRIHALSGSLHIQSVSATLKDVREMPVPHAIVDIGNDKRKTDSNGILKYKFTAKDPSGPYIVNAYKDDKSGMLPTNAVIVLE